MKLVVFCVLAFSVSLCGSRAVLAQPAPEKMPLHGHVSSRGGKPLAGVVVIARKGSAAGGGAFWGGAVLSDEHGDFVLEDAEEGEYVLGGEALGLFGATEPTLSYTLGPRSKPAQLIASAPLKLSLQVLGPGGQSLAGQRLSLATCRTSRDGVTHWRYDTASPTDGALGLTLEPDATLFVSCFAVGWGVLDLRDVPEGSVAERSVALRPGGTLRLSTVEEGTGQPIAGAIPVLGAPQESDLAAASISAADREDGGDSGIANLFHWEAQQRALATGADGALTLPNMRAGLYLVSVRREGFYEPASRLVRVTDAEGATCAITLRRHDTNAPK